MPGGLIILAIARVNTCIYMIFAFLFLEVINKTYIWHHQWKADLHEDG